MGRFVFWRKWERAQIILLSFVYKPNIIVLFSLVFAFDNVGFNSLLIDYGKQIARSKYLSIDAN